MQIAPGRRRGRNRMLKTFCLTRRPFVNTGQREPGEAGCSFLLDNRVGLAYDLRRRTLWDDEQKGEQLQ